MGNNKQIWVFAENACGKPVSVYQELLGKAVELAGMMGNTDVAAVVIGADMDSFTNAVRDTGADFIYVAEHEKLARYDSDNYACAFAELIKRYDPEMVLIGATAIGGELAPTVAAKLKTGLAAHCVDIRLDGDRVNCMVPAFGGRVVSEIYIPDTRPMMASVRPGILDSAECAPVETVEVINADMSFMDSYEPREEFLSFIPNAPSGKPLESSDVIVCAGRGASSDEAWEHLQQFAGKLDAAIGNTRSFVDMGQVDDESSVIGTSGKSVKPRVFIGFGISGASHFVCGMNKSKLIISINKDENAKMFQYSDYGVIGDSDRILTELLNRFEQ